MRWLGWHWDKARHRTRVKQIQRTRSRLSFIGLASVVSYLNKIRVFLWNIKAGI